MPKRVKLFVLFSLWTSNSNRLFQDELFNMKVKWFKISLLQKYVMGVTGLGLAVFLLLHMSGNLLVFLSEKSYNLYAHKLMQNPLLLAFEAGLLFLFVCHILLALALRGKNKKARPVAYARTGKGLKATAFYQKSLLAQGAIILVFVVWHLITFKFGPHYKVVYEGEEVRDLFRLLIEVFQNPVLVTTYLLVLLILSFHLFHGLNSSLKSLGLSHVRFDPWVQKLSLIYTVLVTFGYMILPVYVYCFF